jgi:hypothetical protein
MFTPQHIYNRVLGTGLEKKVEDLFQAFADEEARLIREYPKFAEETRLMVAKHRAVIMKMLDEDLNKAEAVHRVLAEVLRAAGKEV